jgi:hypothetical protein
MGRVELFAEYVAVRFEEQHRDCQRVLGVLLETSPEGTPALDDARRAPTRHQQKGATGKALAALAQPGHIAQDPTAATGWMIIDPLMHQWPRRRGRD